MIRRAARACLASPLAAFLCLAPVPGVAQQQPASYREGVKSYIRIEKEIVSLQGRAITYDDSRVFDRDRAAIEQQLADLRLRWGPQIDKDARAADLDTWEAIQPGHFHFPNRILWNRVIFAAIAFAAALALVIRFRRFLWAVIVFPIALFFKVIVWILRVFLQQGESAVSDNYGTASFANIRYKMPDPYYHHRGIFFGKSSDPLADEVPTLEHPGAPVCSMPQNHSLIVAPTRTGKGTRIIIPTLLSYAGSMLVIDPKGENAAVTARARVAPEGLPHAEVFIINPWGELAETFRDLGFTAATYNPLDVINKDDPNAVAVAQSLAATVCPVTSDKDRFWQGSAANILAAVFLWITDQPGETKTLARAREIVSLSRKQFTDHFLVPMAASSAFDGAIREMVGQYLDLAQETYSGIMSNLSEATKFISDPQTKATTATSSFDMRQLVAYPTTVYLIIPPDRIDTQRTWLRLIVTAATHTYKRAPKEERGVHRCMFLIDEFPAIGRLPDMPRDIATMAGYGVDYTLVVQGVDQLKATYNDAAGAILGNCAYKWYCNLSDLESAKYLSDTLGNKTVQTKGSVVNEEGEKSENFGETGRPLLTPDEIMALGRNVAIVTNPEGRPYYIRPVDYWRLEQAFMLTRSQFPQEYGETFAHVSFDPNPYHTESA